MAGETAKDTMTQSGENVKAKAVLQDTGKSRFRKYRDLCYGNSSLGYVMKAEFFIAMASSASGAFGIYLRNKLFPGLFQKAGRQVMFGRNITLRHPHKISLGNNVIIDDNCVIDAKGETNAGIVIEDDVYIGRNTIIYCKNGDIRIGKRVNISSSCTLFSSNSLKICEDTVIGAYSYLLSGGEYDYAEKEKKFSEQTGMATKGELVVGANCWIGARATVLDGASVGEHCVIGAGAVVTKPVPADSMALGVPAKVAKSIA